MKRVNEGGTGRYISVNHPGKHTGRYTPLLTTQGGYIHRCTLLLSTQGGYIPRYTPLYTPREATYLPTHRSTYPGRLPTYTPREAYIHLRYTHHGVHPLHTLRYTHHGAHPIHTLRYTQLYTRSHPGVYPVIHPFHWWAEERSPYIHPFHCRFDGGWDLLFMPLGTSLSALSCQV